MTRRCFAAFCYFLNRCFPRIAASSEDLSPVAAQLAGFTFSPEQDTTKIQQNFMSLTRAAMANSFKQPEFRSPIVDSGHALESLVEMGTIDAPGAAHREFACSCFELLSKLESGFLESLPSGALRTYHEIARRRVRRDVVVSDALLLSADEVRPRTPADSRHEDVIVMPQFESSRWQCTIVLKDLQMIVRIDPCGTAMEQDTVSVNS